VAQETASETLRIQGQPYTIELAVTPAQRRLGLMHRSGLLPQTAMLLVYPDTAMHNIWMKNVHFPLHLVWLSETGRVLDQQVVPPCQKNPCPIYQAREASRYVLELFPGQLGLQAGQNLTEAEDWQAFRRLLPD